MTLPPVETGTASPTRVGRARAEHRERVVHHDDRVAAPRRGRSRGGSERGLERAGVLGTVDAGAGDEQEGDGSARRATSPRQRADPVRGDARARGAWGWRPGPRHGRAASPSGRHGDRDGLGRARVDAHEDWVRRGRSRGTVVTARSSPRSPRMPADGGERRVSPAQAVATRSARSCPPWTTSGSAARSAPSGCGSAGARRMSAEAAGRLAADRLAHRARANSTGCTLGTLRRLGSVIGIRLDRRGALATARELDRLLGARHSAMHEAMARLFERLPGLGRRRRR